MEKIPCILLVDDDETTNFLNEMLLEEMEITEKLLIAKNGKEAIQAIYDYQEISGNCPTLILLDINMPVMNGFQFLEAFKELEIKNKSSIVIVMLTTSLNPADVDIIHQFNIDGFINKPLTKELVEQIIKENFGNKQ